MIRMQFHRDTFWNLLGLGVPVLAALIAIPFLIKGLGESRFGILALGWMLTGYFTLFDLGVGRSAIRHMVETDGIVETRRSDAFRTSLALHLMLGLLAGVILASLSPWIVSSTLAIQAAFTDEARQSLFWLAGSVPALVATSAFRTALEADRRFDLVNIVRLPSSVANFLMPLAILPLTSRVDLVIAVIVATRWLVLIAYVILVMRFSRGFAGGRFDRSLAGTLLRDGGWMTVSTIVTPLILATDRLVIVTYGSLSMLTHYVVPYEVITKTWILSASLLAAAYPRMTSMRDAELRRLCDLTLRWLAFTATPVVICAILLARPGLTMWVGESIADSAAPVLQILAVGVWLNVLAQVPQTALQATGNANAVGWLQLFELPCYVVLAALLMQSYGLVGIASAWMLRAGLDAVVLVWIANRRLEGFRGWPLGRLA